MSIRRPLKKFNVEITYPSEIDNNNKSESSNTKNEQDVVKIEHTPPDSTESESDNDEDSNEKSGSAGEVIILLILMVLLILLAILDRMDNPRTNKSDSNRPFSGENEKLLKRLNTFI